MLSHFWCGNDGMAPRSPERKECCWGIVDQGTPVGWVIWGMKSYPGCCKDYFISHEIRIPINQPGFHWMSQGFWSLLNSEMSGLKKSGSEWLSYKKDSENYLQSDVHSCYVQVESRWYTYYGNSLSPESWQFKLASYLIQSNSLERLICLLIFEGAPSFRCTLLVFGDVHTWIFLSGCWMIR